MASEQVPDDAAEVTRLFECCICHQGLQDAHICAQCSQPFCRKCIDEWLAKEANCPCCRRALSAAGLVKARTFDQMQQVVNRLVASEGRNRCSEHRKEQLSFFCFPCEQCVCAVCLFSEQHLEHKDQAVLLEVAYGQYKVKLYAALRSMDKRKETLNNSFEKVENNQNLLNEKLNEQKDHLERFEKDRARTDELHGQAEKLLADEKDASTLVKMMEMLQTSEKFLSEEKLEVNLIDVLNQRNLLPEPAVLKFRLERFKETLLKHGKYESLPLTKDGFSWKVQCVKALTVVKASLIFPTGFPCNWKKDSQGITWWKFRMDFVLMMQLRCILSKLKIRIQQARSHAERCIQLEHYVKRLEAKNSENELFMRYLAEYQSKMGSI
ncbi:hypothetical protein pipiens_001919 [Culex pipiens pipiens]|uniref:Uncharacterized protein n=1 Tax=Culex pipiens pipiens TaxID=38569 RepID=A0ABD1DQS5_CULPP